MLTFTDDYSQYTTAYFIKRKSEVLSKFKEYVNSVEKHTGCQIEKLNILIDVEVKVLRSDNGREYTSKNFNMFCTWKGISHEFTAPYCPQQNGVAERSNRTIMEGARSMRYQANLALEFWAEACQTAVYLHNRSPTTTVKNETPFERMFERRPDISNLRFFGRISYVHIPDDQRRKLDAKAHKGIFVGYPPGIKGYKVYDLEKKFIVGRDAQFCEENFNHLDMKIKSKEVSQADLDNMVPNVKKEVDTIAEQSLPAAPSVPEDTELPVSEDTRPSIPNNVKLQRPMNAKQVGAPREERRVRGTFEETFMEEVRNLGPVRERRVPSRYRDDDCLLVDSEIDEPKTVHKAMNGSPLAMES